MTFGSLFAGIGGMDLGLERAGMTVRWQVEIDDSCNRVLAENWPRVRRLLDIRRASGLGHVDLIAGGFPCQDISDASRGRGGGVDGTRSGLWRELVRVVSEVCPKWVLVENVDGAAWRQWVPVMRRALHDIGYPSVPIRVRAADVGAACEGSRIFVAASYGEGESARAVHAKMAELQEAAAPLHEVDRQPPSLALGVADGVPARMDRLRIVGNAVDPRLSELIGRAILEAA